MEENVKLNELRVRQSDQYHPKMTLVNLITLQKYRRSL